MKKNVLFVGVSIGLLLLLGVGVSYSYYLANITTSNEENKNSEVTTNTITQVVMDMQDKVSINGAYPGHKAVKEVVVRGVGNANSIPANASIKVTPDLGVFTNDITWKLYKSEDDITCNNTLQISNGSYYEEGTCTIPSSATLELEGTSASAYKNIVVSPNTETKYYLVIEYLNKEEDQSSQMNNTFSIDIGLGEKIPPKFIDNIVDLSKTDTTNFASDDPDNNIRYIGANPDNYVYFNCSDYGNQSDSTCEKWRIIGLFNNVTKSDGTKENLVKIIRDDRLNNTNFVWDYKKTGVGTSTSSYGSNDWTDSQLMMMLNPTNYLKSGYTNSNDIIFSGSQQLYRKMGSYYNGTRGCNPEIIASGSAFSCAEVNFTSSGLKNYTTRNAIEEVVWNLGGANTYDSSSNGLASHWYGYERGTTVYSGRPTTWTGKIGLMYPSDYGYATSGSSSTTRATCLAKELYSWNSSSDCYNNDYLYKSNYHQWTLAPDSGDPEDVLAVPSVGFISKSSAYGAFGVRPALYLKSNISVVDGTGSSTSPYKLGM